MIESRKDLKEYLKQDKIALWCKGKNALPVSAMKSGVFRFFCVKPNIISTAQRLP